MPYKGLWHFIYLRCELTIMEFGAGAFVDTKSGKFVRIEFLPLCLFGFGCGCVIVAEQAQRNFE